MLQRLGLLLIIIGILFWSGALSWFGKLPGDIRLQRGYRTIFIPLTSIGITLVLLSLLFRLGQVL